MSLSRVGITALLAGSMLVVSGVALPGASRVRLVPTGNATIKITNSLVSTRIVNPIHIVRTYQLYNKPNYKKALGNEIEICHHFGKGDVLGGGIDWCHVYLRMPRGTIVLDGPVSNRDFYRLAIVGGIGYYANLAGDASFQRLGGDVQLVLVQAIAV